MDAELQAKRRRECHIVRHVCHTSGLFRCIIRRRERIYDTVYEHRNTLPALHGLLGVPVRDARCAPQPWRKALPSVHVERNPNRKALIIFDATSCGRRHWLALTLQWRGERRFSRILPCVAGLGDFSSIVINFEVYADPAIPNAAVLSFQTLPMITLSTQQLLAAVSASCQNAGTQFRAKCSDCRSISGAICNV